MANLSYIPQVVSFHGRELMIVEHEGQPYTPMKSIVEGMGLTWQSQHRKLTENSKRWGIIKMMIPTLGDIQEAICLPLRKLLAWLITISPNKVKPALRDTVIMFQDECDDVLWEYWTRGQVINHRKVISPEQQHVLHSIVDRRAGNNQGLRKSLWKRHNNHFGVAKYSQLLSIHFDDAKQYLEMLPLQTQAPVETDTFQRLERFVDNLAARYPALENPIIQAINKQFCDLIRGEKLIGRQCYWVVVDNGDAGVQQLPAHFAPTNIVQLADAFNALHEVMVAGEVLDHAKALKKMPFKSKKM